MGAYSNCFAHAFAEAADGACYAAEETWVRQGLAVVVRRGREGRTSSTTVFTAAAEKSAHCECGCGLWMGFSLVF